MSIKPQRRRSARSNRGHIAGVTVALLVATSGLAAQTGTIPIRELSAPEQTSSKPFKLILQTHSLPDGRVLVNDGGARRLVVLGKSLAEESVLLDSSSGSAYYYGSRATPIIRYLGDSALFVDGESSTLLLISPKGTVARTLSPPKPSDLRWLTINTSGVDANGNLVYRGAPPQTGAKPGTPATRAELLAYDSIAVVRANFDTRVVDTVAHLILPTDRRTDLRVINGQSQTTIFHKPPVRYDEWAVTSEGLIAVLRGETYQIALYDAAGKKRVETKLPFDWRVFTDEEKQQVLDSARAAADSSAARAAAAPPLASATLGRAAGVPNIALRSPVAAAPPAHVWITPGEMPSYWPSIRQGAVSADRNGNVWILPATSSASTDGSLVYDVVNNKGVLTHRVRMPAGRVVAGFAKDGRVYTSVKQPDGMWALEVRSIK